MAKNCPICNQIKHFNTSNKNFNICNNCAKKLEIKTKFGIKKWSLQKLESGFDTFFQSYGRMPTAHEIDSYPLLPSSRQLQRRFGGLEKLRKVFGHSIVHFNKGQVRSKMVGNLVKSGLDYEDIVEKILVDRFGEVFVHKEKQYIPRSKKSVDFLVYANNLTFGIDVFHSKDEFSFAGSINHKIKVYADFPTLLIFLLARAVGFPGFFASQEEIDKIILNKKNPLPDNRKVYSLNTFKKWIDSIKPIDYSVLKNVVCVGKK